MLLVDESKCDCGEYRNGWNGKCGAHIPDIVFNLVREELDKRERVVINGQRFILDHDVPLGEIRIQERRRRR